MNVMERESEFTEQSPELNDINNDEVETEYNFRRKILGVMKTSLGLHKDN